MTVLSRTLLCAAVAVVVLFLLAADAGKVPERPVHAARSTAGNLQENRRGIVLAVAVSVVQSALIIALVMQRRRRQRVEESLRESEERISLATLPVNLGLWRWDANTDEIWATEHFREILQVPAAVPLTRSSVRAGIHPSDRARFDEAFARPMNGEVLDCDFRVLHATGELRWVTGKARARRDSLGRIVRVIGVVMDITDRKEAEAESQNQRLQLAHLTRVAILGQLSGALAHELTQPLTAILSNAQAAQRFLSASSVDLEEIRAILDDIVSDDKRAGDVIRRVRALLKRGETQLQQLDLQQLIREALTVAHSDLVVRQVEVTCRLAPGLPAVQGDRVQIQQILLNLLLNAAEAMAANGPQDRRIDIAVEADAQGVQISIADCGMGIARTQLENVFDAFYTTKSNGLGLGLAICRSIVVAHGGRLWATNNVDRGSTFHFTLPTALVPETHDCCSG